MKTLVFRVVPDESTRLAALKRGEVDVAYHGESVKRNFIYEIRGGSFREGPLSAEP